MGAKDLYVVLFNTFHTESCTVPTYRRSRIELYVDVLRAIYNGRVSPSRIVYAANLSYDRVVRCLKFLEDQDLVQKVEGIKKKRYRITERGCEVIKYFNEVETYLFHKKKIFSNVNIHYGSDQ